MLTGTSPGGESRHAASSVPWSTQVPAVVAVEYANAGDGPGMALGQRADERGAPGDGQANGRTVRGGSSGLLPSRVQVVPDRE